MKRESNLLGKYYGLRVGENAARSVNRPDDVRFRQMPERLRPIDGRKLLGEVERL